MNPHLKTDAAPELTPTELYDAEQILADLNDLSNRLGKSAPKDEAFYAVNRAWRNMSAACELLKELVRKE